jgi:hypothetical protein
LETPPLQPEPWGKRGEAEGRWAAGHPGMLLKQMLLQKTLLLLLLLQQQCQQQQQLLLLLLPLAW